jgi:hypothetical protein
MNPRKSPAANRALITNQNGERISSEWCTRQFRSPEEIAFANAMRTLPLLAELRQVGHRLDAYRNGGQRK